MLIMLDDLQWADEASVLLVRDLAERLGNSKIVLIGTYWDTDLDPALPFTSVVTRLLRRRRAQRISLGRLSDADVEKMLTVMAGTALSPVQLVGIQAAAEGNPLFVEHSYLYMAESEGILGGVHARSQGHYTEEDLELAQSVRGLIGRRLERLSEPAHRMLIAAAVFGRDFDLTLLEAFGELSGGELREALEEASKARLLTKSAGDRYRFSHDLVRQRVLAGMPLPRLQAYHLAVADTLERVYGKTAKEHAFEIANHLYQAGTSADAMRTSSFLAQAAKNALAVAAYEEALRNVESELLLLPADKIKERATAMALKGDALAGLGRNEEARSAWGVAAQRFEDAGDKKSAISIRSRLDAPIAVAALSPAPAEAAETAPSGNGVEVAALPEAQPLATETPQNLN
ncbi:MAG TPA: hypothetical protein VJQ84_05445 [Solirubrobacterales bacterium]|nr:hypothetical protein [Solirubrobacterales bacterium]